jgi:hypothetical protein
MIATYVSIFMRLMLMYKHHPSMFVEVPRSIVFIRRCERISASMKSTTWERKLLDFIHNLESSKILLIFLNLTQR